MNTTSRQSSQTSTKEKYFTGKFCTVFDWISLFQGGNQPAGPGYFPPPYPAMYPPQTVNAVVSNEPTIGYSGPVVGTKIMLLPIRSNIQIPHW